MTGRKVTMPTNYFLDDSAGFLNASKHVDPNLVVFQAVMKYIEEMETIYPRPPSVHEQSNQNNVNIDKI